MIKRLVVGALAFALLVIPAPAIHAEEVKNKGLFVTPVREFIGLSPGGTEQKSITFANNTDKPMALSLNVEQFTVADYSYDFNFKKLSDDWVKLSRTEVDLQPGKSTSVSYTITPPQNAAPGGHYFTIFASATVQNGGVASKVRAATTVYVTVQGKLQVAASVQKFSLPRFAFSDISFDMDIKNTGNTHFFVYVSGEMYGTKGPEVTHLLMPGTVRTVGSTIPAPIFPGIFTASIGYTADGGHVVQRTKKIVYIPPWSFFALIGLVWIGIVALRRHRHRSRVARDYRVSHR